MTLRTGKLPDVPSELIRLALRDLARVERTKDYTVSMLNWHIGKDRDLPCEVCFAGAVMAMSLGVAKTETVHSEAFETGTRLKLCALDNFRAGAISAGLAYMELPIRDVPEAILLWRPDVVDYEDDPRRWRRQMHRIARKLEAHGL